MTAAAYVLLNVDDVPLYIGSSGDVAARVRQHRSKSFWPEVASLEVHNTETLAEARDLERRLIRERNPLHNVVRMVTAPGEPRPRRVPPKAFLESARQSVRLSRQHAADGAGLALADYVAVETGERVASGEELAGIERALGFPVGSLRYESEGA